MASIEELVKENKELFVKGRKLADEIVDAADDKEVLRLAKIYNKAVNNSDAGIASAILTSMLIIIGYIKTYKDENEKDAEKVLMAALTHMMYDGVHDDIRKRMQ